MAQKTLDEWASDLEDLLEIAEKYTELPAGPARNMMHMIYFGLSRLHDHAEKNRTGRAKVARYRARKREGVVPGQMPLWGPDGLR